MTDLDNSPVSLVELKQHLRIYHDLLDENLTIMLLAAVEKVEEFTGIDFSTDYTDRVIPFKLKAAILLTAGRLFENPTDGVSNLPTIVESLITGYRWKEKK